MERGTKTGCGSSHRLQDCNKREIKTGCGSSRHLQDCNKRERDKDRLRKQPSPARLQQERNDGRLRKQPSPARLQQESDDGCFRSVPLYLSIQSSFNVGDPGSSSTCSRNSRRRLAWALNGSSEVRQHQLRQVPAQAAATGLVKVLLEYTRLTEFQVPSMRGQTAISPSWQRYKAESPQTAAPPEWLAQVLFR